MTHYAKVQKGVVINVIVAEPDFFDTFADNSPGEWIQTSYNTRGGVHYGPDDEPDGGVALRKNYAGVGMLYDVDRDAFYTAKPFPSWVLNDTTCLWEAPISKPDGFYYWDEVAHQADSSTGWVAVEEDE